MMHVEGMVIVVDVLLFAEEHLLLGIFCAPIHQFSCGVSPADRNDWVLQKQYSLSLRTRSRSR
jgi:hypothetical protein